MSADPELSKWVLVWAVGALYLVVRHWRDGGGVGLLLTYLVSFGVLQWFPAALHLLPWFDTRTSDLVTAGMEQSGFAMIGLVVGTEIMARLVRRPFSPPTEVDQPAGPPILERGSVRFLLVAGFFLYAVLSRVGSGITGLQAVAATGSAVLVVGLSLEIWNAWASANRSGLRAWMAAPLLLPVVTVITQGFLGYGFAAMLTVYAFAATLLRPRWRVLVATALLGYVGLSVYITYMRDRTDIRQTVWGGGGFSERASQLRDTFAGMEWFDYRNRAHLDRVENRLNQSVLVGAAVTRLERGFVPYADGRTLEDAALSLIPRILWPDKPTVAGSGDLVATYTGMRFAEGTSVGVGQLLECYINFGSMGVVVGFCIIGGLLVLADRSALYALERGDAFHFTVWYLPALGLLQVGGSFAEAVSTAGAGLLVAVVLGAIGRRMAPATRVGGLTPVGYSQSESQ